MKTITVSCSACGQSYTAPAGALTNCPSCTVTSLDSPLGSTQPAPLATTAVQTSSPLSEFERLGELGRGGMGVVYRVRDKKLGRMAALKVLVNAKAGSQLVARFLREARVTACLDHPSIPAVFDAGHDDNGAPYLLMRLIEGDTLSLAIRALHKRKGASPRPCLEALVKVGEAVAHAHGRQVLHRDLKPDNIMVGKFGEVLVMDWGLATPLREDPNELSALAAPTLLLGDGANDVAAETVLFEKKAANADADSSLTTAGTVMGTAGYMSPEQALGETVDERADVFALGAILTEILTGRPPVKGAAMARIAKTIEGELDSPRDRRPDVSRELDWIARHALAPERMQRTASAAQFVAQLRASLAGEPVPGFRYNAREQAEAWVRRHPFALILSSAGVVILAVTVVLGLSWLAEWQARASAEQEIARRSETLEGFSEARALVRRQRPGAVVVARVKQALGTRPSYEELLTAAQILERASQFNDARALLDQAIERHPPALQALYMLHFLELGERGTTLGFAQTSALERLIKAVKDTGARNEYQLFAEAQRLIKAGDIVAALECLKEIEDHTPRLSQVWGQRGLCQLMLADDRAAVAAFSRGLRIDPRSLLCYLYRGIAHWRLARLGEARSDLDFALSIDDKAALGYHFRALVRHQDGDFKGAIADFSRAIALDPSNAHGYFGRGLSQVERHEWPPAIGDFTKTTELAEDFIQKLPAHQRIVMGRSIADTRAEAFCERAFARRSAKEAKHSAGWQEDLRRAESIVRSPAVIYARAKCHFLKDEKDQAAQFCTEALQKDPRYSAALKLRAEIAFQSQKFEASLKDFAAIAKQQPDNPDAHFYVGLSNVGLGRGKAALVAYDRAIALDPSNHLRHYFRGMVREHLGDLQSAIEDFEVFLRYANGDPRVQIARKKVAALKKKLQR